MDKRIARGLIVLAILTASFAASAQNVDHKILGIESGYVFGYDLGSGDLGNAGTVALNITLTDNLTAGFAFLNGTAPMPVTASLLNLNYGLADRFGFALSFGRDTTAGTTLAGFGMYFNIFERKVQDSLASVLKTRIEYLFDPTAGLDSGDLVIGLSVSVGM